MSRSVIKLSAMDAMKRYEKHVMSYCSNATGEYLKTTRYMSWRHCCDLKPGISSYSQYYNPSLVTLINAL